MTNITVVIATYNSKSRLPILFENISNQILDNGNDVVQILVVDGGSSDATVETAKLLGAEVIMNPKGDAINAKYLGYLNAKSDVICFLDHDETFGSKMALKRRIEIFQNHSSIVGVCSSGYNVAALKGINSYVSEFGETYSLFKYRFPNNSRIRPDMIQKVFNVAEDRNDAIFILPKSAKRNILLELVACGGVIHRGRINERYEGLIQKPSNMVLIYNELSIIDNSDLNLAFLKNDDIFHESVESIYQVLNKVRWRIQNNASVYDELGESGKSGRKKFEKSEFWKNDFFFALYVMLVFPIVADSIQMAIRRRNLSYLWNIWIGLYILYFVIKKRTLESKIEKKRYDGS
jgi:glycosyltransferase involved in cell wall biosynthesis